MLALCMWVQVLGFGISTKSYLIFLTELVPNRSEIRFLEFQKNLLESFFGGSIDCVDILVPIIYLFIYFFLNLMTKLV